jgi:predicted nucleic acid-binding protein
VRSLRTYVLDTSVLITYITENAIGRERVLSIIEEARRGKVQLYTVYPVLSELLYASTRVYEMAGLEEPNVKALDFLLWIEGLVDIVELTHDIALRAGELKRLSRIALTDCYVIATAESLNSTALFLRVEKEMGNRMDLIRRLPIEFLVEG